MDEEIPRELLPPFIPKYFEEVFDFFGKIKTQWVVCSGMTTQPIGLNYPAVIAVAEIYKFELNEFRFDVLREIESFYLEKGR